MNVLDLFSGIGGFSLGLERAGMTTVAFCEIDPFARAVLRKHWPHVPCYDDVRTIPALGGIDLICGGFPCQPWSSAGKRMGAEDDRHLWPSMLEVIQRERPAWVIGESVAGIISMGLDQILADLEAIDYAARTFVIPAGAVGAPHIRYRIWIVARDRHRDGQSTGAVNDEARGLQGLFADPHGSRLEGGGQSGDSQGRQEPDGHAGLGGGSGRHWETESGVLRVANGIPNRTHRIKAIGNAVVPQIPEIIGRAIMKVSA